MLKVSEIFSSVQGEGRFLGRPSTFLRLTRCNLHCWFCDTDYTWRFTDTFEHRNDKVYAEEDQEMQLDITTVFNRLQLYPNSHVVITGGEPLLQSGSLLVLLQMLDADLKRKWSVEFETAGTLAPIDNKDLVLPIYYTVSPKLESSKNELKLRRRMEMLNLLAVEDSVFKFVVCKLSDFDEVDELVGLLKLQPNDVYIMAEGIDAETLNRNTARIMKITQLRGYNLTTRLQVLMWGNKRGV